jgi:hypothetical protein
VALLYFFPILFHKTTRFLEKPIIQYYFLIFSAAFVRNISNTKKNSERVQLGEKLQEYREIIVFFLNLRNCFGMHK